jgi:hypothetical protein
MKRLFLSVALSALFLSLHALGQSDTQEHAAAPADPRCFELRTYYAAPGKLDELHARFRDHTIQIFNSHAMQSVGYWVPVDNPNHILIYILAFPSREARNAAWRAFGADPEWQKTQKASEANGRLVTKVDSILMSATDYSPVVKAESSGSLRLFELRTYTAAEGKLGDLNKRFREKTVALFNKHNIHSIGYWVPLDQNKGADNTLIYLVAHPNQQAATENWKAFFQDSDWIAAKHASEVHGALTITNGVKSIFLRPTDYSPLK